MNRDYWTGDEYGKFSGIDVEATPPAPFNIQWEVEARSTGHAANPVLGITMIIQTEVTRHNYDLSLIVNEFEKKETTLTGSLIIHKGKVKSPGKNVLNLSHILL